MFGEEAFKVIRQGAYLLIALLFIGFGLGVWFGYQQWGKDIELDTPLVPIPPIEVPDSVEGDTTGWIPPDSSKVIPPRVVTVIETLFVDPTEETSLTNPIQRETKIYYTTLPLKVNDFKYASVQIAIQGYTPFDLIGVKVEKSLFYLDTIYDQEFKSQFEEQQRAFETNMQILKDQIKQESRTSYKKGIRHTLGTAAMGSFIYFGIKVGNSLLSRNN